MIREYVCAIGGANVDITGKPYIKLVEDDSNPGETTLSLGGVSRNIAENLSRLGIEVKLITVLGGDRYAREIKDNCCENGITLAHSLILNYEKTSTFLCINDENGNMKLGISDMNIYKYLTPDYLSQKMHVINKASLCVVDTNLPVESLDYLMTNSLAPIFLDTVSVKKAEKVKDILHNVHTIKPNKAEAEVITGIKINSEEDLKKASKFFIEKGVKQVFISLGEKGVFYDNSEVSGIIKNSNKDVVNTTGAGDGFMAAVAFSYIKGLDILTAAKIGVAASNIATLSQRAVNDDMSITSIENFVVD